MGIYQKTVRCIDPLQFNYEYNKFRIIGRLIFINDTIEMGAVKYFGVGAIISEV